MINAFVFMPQITPKLFQNNRNVNVMNRFADTANAKPGGQFYSVSSSSFSSSSNLNGQEQSRRSAETVVNNNGQVTKYKVES